MLGDNWGATAAERGGPLPCDGLMPHAAVRVARAITIHAAPAVVFAWLCQLRLAPYSYDLLDNFGRTSPRERRPDMAELEVGQRFMTLFTLASFSTDEHITLQTRGVAVTYAVVPVGSSTRLVVRVLFDPPGGRAVARLLALGDLIMMRKQLLTLKALAERDSARLPSGHAAH